MPNDNKNSIWMNVFVNYKQIVLFNIMKLITQNYLVPAHTLVR